MNKAKITAGVIALAIPVVAAFEGLVLRPYRDPIGKLTWCYGETRDRPAEFTPANCQALLVSSLQRHGEAITPCLPERLPEHVLAATLSFAYNVGPGAFCGSTMARKLKAGDIPGACAELSRWTYAGGKQLPGLVKRRTVERAMCEGKPASLGALG